MVVTLRVSQGARNGIFFHMSILTKSKITATDSSTCVRVINPQTNRCPSSLYWCCWERQDYSKSTPCKATSGMCLWAGVTPLAPVQTHLKRFLDPEDLWGPIQPTAWGVQGKGNSCISNTSQQVIDFVPFGTPSSYENIPPNRGPKILFKCKILRFECANFFPMQKKT